MLPYQEIYEYRGEPERPVHKSQQAIMADLRGIAEEVTHTYDDPRIMFFLAGYQRRMNEYMAQHGIVFYQP